MKKLSIFITIVLLFLAGCTATKGTTEVVEPVEEVPVPQEVQTPAVEPEPVASEPDPLSTTPL